MNVLATGPNLPYSTIVIDRTNTAREIKIGRISPPGLDSAVAKAIEVSMRDFFVSEDS